ncbi:MAG: hypothetical protein WD688_18935 [Candidatus Binatia bacterium]
MVLVVPIPVSATEALPALLAIETLPSKAASAGGLNLTVIVLLSPAPKLNELSPKMLNGALVLALPVRVPLPVFWTVKVRSFDVPTVTVWKSRGVGGVGVTDKTGDDDGGGKTSGPMNCPIEKGEVPTCTAPTTAFVAVSITETVLLSQFATYTRLPSGCTATPRGRFPTITVFMRIFVAVAKTETVLVLAFAT